LSANDLVLSRVEGGVLRLTLNRPDIRNALNDDLMRRVIGELDRHREDPAVRVVLFTGAGDSFCAGADLQWMRETMDLTYEETLENSDLLAELFYGIYEYPKPTIVLVNGPAVGGGVGFVATCDVVVTAAEAFYRLSEVRLGLIPAVISPFVLAKIGEGRCRELMLTGRKVTAEESLAIGLSSQVCPRAGLAAAGERYARWFLAAGPEALATCKEILGLAARAEPAALRRRTVEVIARLRTGPEGQEGMAAFLEKRAPSWQEEGR